MQEQIHCTAIVSPKSKLGSNVKIGPYCIIAENVEIGDNTELKNNVTIESYVKIGKNNKIFSGAVIGSIPQDLKFGNEITNVEIGDNNTIREFVTVSRGTKHGGKITRIGNNNMLMAYSHIAHDCQVGSNIVLANVATLAGHVEIMDNAIIGGLTAIHQFVKIGRFSIVGGMTRVPKDVIPFSSIASKTKTKIYGVNKIGLMRHGFSAEDRMIIHKAFKIILREGNNISQAVEILKSQYCENEYVKEIVDFIESSKRGIIR